MNRTTEHPVADARWQGLWKLGGVAALAIAVLLLGEIAVYALLPRSTTAMEHLALFHDRWLVGLLTLDLLGMISYLLFVPMILALYVVLRRTSESVMIVATAVFFVGIADFFATNTAFSMLSLSGQYANAATETERAMVLAAGQAMLTLFNENAFLVSYVIVSAAWVMISGVMLRSAVFGRLTSWAGILAGAAGIVAVVLEHITGTGALLASAIGLYFAAIVLLLIWVALAGRRLLQLGSIRAVAGQA
jgi:hypothetical protein